jgi:hypothetical protein
LILGGKSYSQYSAENPIELNLQRALVSILNNRKVRKRSGSDGTATADDANFKRPRLITDTAITAISNESAESTSTLLEIDFPLDSGADTRATESAMNTSFDLLAADDFVGDEYQYTSTTTTTTTMSSDDDFLRLLPDTAAPIPYPACVVSGAEIMDTGGMDELSRAADLESEIEDYKVYIQRLEHDLSVAREHFSRLLHVKSTISSA